MILIPPTANKSKEKGFMPSKKAELAKSKDWMIKKLRLALICLVATIPKADMINSPPANAFRFTIKGVVLCKTCIAYSFLLKNACKHCNYRNNKCCT